jgi:DnaK suppressor protein
MKSQPRAPRFAVSPKAKGSPKALKISTIKPGAIGAANGGAKDRFAAAAKPGQRAGKAGQNGKVTGTAAKITKPAADQGPAKKTATIKTAAQTTISVPSKTKTKPAKPPAGSNGSKPALKAAVAGAKAAANKEATGGRRPARALVAKAPPSKAAPVSIKGKGGKAPAGVKPLSRLGAQKLSTVSGKSAGKAAKGAPPQAGKPTGKNGGVGSAPPSALPLAKRGVSAAQAPIEVGTSVQRGRGASNGSWDDQGEAVRPKAWDHPNGAGGVTRHPLKFNGGVRIMTKVTITELPPEYRPSDKEPFMCELQRLYFKRKLAAWRDEIVRSTKDTLQSLHEDQAHYADIADRATSESDKALELRARDRQRKLIAKIEAAMERIDRGTYGYCDETGEPIAVKRLDARPIATLSIEAQERHERRERVYRDD